MIRGIVLPLASVCLDNGNFQSSSKRKFSKKHFFIIISHDWKFFWSALFLLHVWQTAAAECWGAPKHVAKPPEKAGNNGEKKIRSFCTHFQNECQQLLCRQMHRKKKERVSMNVFQARQILHGTRNPQVRRNNYTSQTAYQSKMHAPVQFYYLYFLTWQTALLSRGYGNRWKPGDLTFQGHV